MGDPLSTIASILAILDATTAVYKKVHDAARLPKAFQKISAQITLAWDTLAAAEDRYKTNTSQDASSIQKTLESCEQDAKDLLEMYEVVCEHIDSNWLPRYKRHISNLRHGRKEKVEEVWKRILETLQVLTSYHIFRNLPTPPEKLTSAIKEIEEVEDSAPEQDVGSTYNYNAAVGVSHSGAGAATARVALGNMVGKFHAKDTPEKCLRALFITDPAEDLVMVRRRAPDDQGGRARYGQAPGTCRWIEEDDGFVKWRNTSSPAILLLTGEHGIGKTTLATHVIELLNRVGDTSNLAYFFCNDNAKYSKRNSTESILRGLLWMLLKQDPTLFRHFERQFYTKGSRMCSDRRTLWHIFRAIANDPGVQATILIDALDECKLDSRTYLLQELQSWTEEKSELPSKIKIAIFSRPDDLLEGLRVPEPWTRISIRMDPSKIHDDLSIFVEHELARLVPTPPDKPRWSTEEVEQVRRVLRTGDSFLWISLALEYLKGMPYIVYPYNSSYWSLVHTLKELPPGLMPLYDHIVEAIKPDDARRALHIVLSANQLLSTDALATACFISKNQDKHGGFTNLPNDSQINNLKGAIRACKLLQLPPVDEEMISGVTIIHQSVVDFVDYTRSPYWWHRSRMGVDQAVAAAFKSPRLSSTASSDDRASAMAELRLKHDLGLLAGHDGNTHASMQPTGNAYSEVRQMIVATLGCLRVGQPLQLSIEWDPKTFMADQYPNETCSIADVLVYCGEPGAAYVTAAHRYASRLWPSVGADTICSIHDFIQDACHDRKDVPTSRIYRVGDANFDLELHDGALTMQIRGSRKDALAIAEVAVWLSTACRMSELDRVGYCVPKIKQVQDGLFASFESWGASDAELSGLGSCWFSMVRNPLIANGYPVPRREDTERQKGLEVEFPLMVTLAKADFMIEYLGVMMLKGLVSGLVPVLDLTTSVVWHFLLNKDGTRMDYNELHDAGATPPVNLSIESLQERRHFVGVWATSVNVTAGTESHGLYEMKRSGCESAESYSGSISNLSVSGGKVINFGAAFNIAKRDVGIPLETSATQPFELIIHFASQMTVLFFGCHDRRGWLVDGATALMHMSRLWLSSDGARFMDPSALEKIHYVKAPGGKDAAMNALMKNKESSIVIFRQKRTQLETISSELPAQSTSGSTPTSSQRKVTTTDWTFQDLATDMYLALEHIRDSIADSQRANKQVKINPKQLKESSQTLIGWELDDAVLRARQLDQKKLQMNSNAEDWIKLAKQLQSVVLLSQTFGDLITPTQMSGCIRMSPVPTGRDYLTVPIELIRTIGNINETDAIGDCVKLTPKLCWTGYKLKLPHCHGRCCEFRTRVGACPKPKSHGGIHSNGTTSRVFSSIDGFPNGAAVIGGPNKLNKVPEQGWCSRSH